MNNKTIVGPIEAESIKKFATLINAKQHASLNVTFIGCEDYTFPFHPLVRHTSIKIAAEASGIDTIVYREKSESCFYFNMINSHYQIYALRQICLRKARERLETIQRDLIGFTVKIHDIEVEICSDGDLEILCDKVWKQNHRQLCLWCPDTPSK